MRVTRLTLENIKSYQYAEIDLTTGVNAICGMNGAGKTTVLEAIGLTLFDFLPYKHEHFRREGEKTGTIRVRLETRVGREYEVVRRIGGGNSYYVHDVQGDGRVAERGPSVLDWVRRTALDLDYEADLQALFQNAIGVPQGRMTADFQAAPAPRKKTFDPLLRVEEYRDAYENLRETMSWLRDQRANLSQEIARIEAETDKMPEVRAQVEECAGRLRHSEEALARLAADLLDVEAKLAVLDEMERTVRSLGDDVRGAEYDARRHADKLAIDEEYLQAARAARATIEAAEPGFRAVVAARDRLRELEPQRAERDRLNTEISDVKATMHGLNGNMRQLDEERRQALEAAAEAADLADAVARQDDLERQQSEVRAALSGLPELHARVEKVAADEETLRAAIGTQEAKLKQARDAGGEIGRLSQIREELATTAGRLGEMRSIRQHRDEIETDGKRLRSQLEEFQASLGELPALRDKMAEQQPAAAQLEWAASRHDELREQQVRLSATIEYQAVARSHLAQHTCPLLDLKCPVVASDGSVLARFETRVGGLQAELDAVDRELQTVAPVLESARAAAESLQLLAVQVARLEGTEASLRDVEAQIVKCRHQYGELSKLLAEEPALKGRQAELESEAQRVQELVDLAARLPLMEEQRSTDIARLKSLEQELADLRAREGALAAVRDRDLALEADLKGLDNPRAKREGLSALAARRPQLEAAIRRYEVQLTDESHRLKALVGKLQPFATLDDEIARQQAVQAENEDAFNSYLAAEPESRQLEEREKAAEQTRTLLEAARQAEREARERLQEATGRYDGEDHQRRKEEREDLRERMGEENGRREQVEQRLRECETESARLERLQTRLKERRDEADELERVSQSVGFIRDTIKTAGPAVTERILANISQTASDIYAEIMDDHTAELRWDRDYEILVQRGAETRSFSQLSGGEQMSAALAVRLALLKELSEVDIAFFDEPTQNMDVDRRSNLAAQIGRVKGFDQLIVISHDDTFEHHTDNLIRLAKVDEATQVEAG